MSATNMSLFQIPPAYRAYPRNIPGNIFFPNWWILDWSFGEIGQYSTNETKGMIGTINGFSEPPFVKCFPIRQEILNVSQTGFKFHGICPPFSIQTWLQQYRRGAFFYSEHCSFRNPLVSDLCGVDVQWFQERSSQALSNPRNCQCKWL